MWSFSVLWLGLVHGSVDEQSLSSPLTSVQMNADIDALLRQPSFSAISLDHWDDLLEDISPFALPDSVVVLASSEGLYLLSVLFASGSTAVYDVTDAEGTRTDIVIVYRQYCYRPKRPVNTVGVDYWTLWYLQGSGIVPRVYDMSGPLFGSTVLSVFGSYEDADGKVEMTNCYGYDVIPEVRYIVMEKMYGGSVGDLVYEMRGSEGRGISVAVAMKLGINMIETLRILHSHNVIHGDAHMGNFMIGDGNSDDGLLKLIDFERATVFNLEEYMYKVDCDKPDFLTRLSTIDLITTAWHSIWAASGCPTSFRDDLHLVFVSIATMIHGEAYFEFVDQLAEGWNNSDGKRNFKVSNLFSVAWRDIRERGKVFEVTGFTDFMERNNLRNVLNEMDRVEFPLVEGFARNGLLALEEILASMTLTDRPDYDRIVTLMSNIADNQ